MVADTVKRVIFTLHIKYEDVVSSTKNPAFNAGPFVVDLNNLLSSTASSLIT